MSTKSFYFQFTVLVIAALLVIIIPSCTESTPKGDQTAFHIIPKPVSLIEGEGLFQLNDNTKLIALARNSETQKLLVYIKETIGTATGLSLNIDFNNAHKNAILLQLDPQINHSEGYHLKIESDLIKISAKSMQGLFYGVQTIRQIITNSKEKWVLPAIEINDYPRFEYRGMHLDVARHFFDVETVKEYIDQIAYHKMNRFHWHLTEDQGWRIEIKKYPKLTEVGAFRNSTLIGHASEQPKRFNQEKYGGFYTQEEVRDIVAYANTRYVTIVPEIEMPGHSQAAIASYPELGCTGEQLEVWNQWGVSENVYCPYEETFTFLEGVLDEVIDLFPGEYIHIGGDECPKTQWKESRYCQNLIKQEGLKDEHELQSYFIQRMEKYINTKGRKIIGWDEILEGGLAPNATVMSWRGVKGGIEAARQSHDVIMTPTSHCYFDYYQKGPEGEPLAIGGMNTLENVYSFEPIPTELTAEQSRFILGAQGNLWTEYIPTKKQLHYMAFPRMCALSEVVWSANNQRDYEDFKIRLMTHTERLESMGIIAADF